MKTLKVGAYIRPAMYTDIFDSDTKAFFKIDQQVYYKNADDTIRGPYRIDVPLIFMADEYVNFLQLIADEQIFVVDGNKYVESVQVVLPLQEATFLDISEFNHTNGLIHHTVFYIIIETKVSGPFVITKKTVPADVLKYIQQKQFFILDNISNLKKIETLTTAKAV